MNASFYNEIKKILISARNKVYQTANFAMVEAYWNIGKSIIEEQGGRMTQKELSDACLIEVTTMSRTLDRLEKMGLIIRENNPECRRSWIIKLTKEGEAKADEVSDLFNMAEDIFCQDISEEELSNMCATLEKIERNLNEAIKKQDETA